MERTGWIGVGVCVDTTRRLCLKWCNKNRRREMTNQVGESDLWHALFVAGSKRNEMNVVRQSIHVRLPLDR